MKWLIVSLVLLISNTSLSQYFNIKNTSIQNLQTDVTVNQTLKIVFSEPLDLSYNAALNERGDMDNIPVPFIRTYLENAANESDYFSSYLIGQTSDTLFVTLNAEPNKVYSLRFIRAQSMNGNNLIPFELTFSTGVNIPDNTVSGSVTGIHDGTLKFAFAVRSDAPMPDAIDRGGFYGYRYAPIADDGSFQLKNMGNGSFFVFAMEDNNSISVDAPLDFNIGLFDQNMDGFADTLFINNNGSPDNISMTIKPFVMSSTAESKASAELLAQQALPGSFLVGVFDSERSDTNGLSGIWSYVYYNPVSEKAFALNFSGTEPIINFNAENIFDLEFLPVPLSNNWINSNIIAPISYDYYKTLPVYDIHPDIILSISLLSAFSINDDDQNSKNQTAGRLSGFGDILRAEKSSLTDETVHPYWYIKFRVPEENGSFTVETALFDAVSGLRIDFSPQNAKTMYNAFKAYAEGNELLMLGGDVDSDGKSEQWGAVVYNTISEKIDVYVSFGTYVTPFPVDSAHYWVDVNELSDLYINEPWLDSDTIVHIMDSLYFKENFPFYLNRMLVLSHENRSFPPDTALYWIGEYEPWNTGPVGNIKSTLLDAVRKMRQSNLKTENRTEADEDMRMSIKLNARTGLQIIENGSTALSQIPMAVNIAKMNWSSDAQLFGISSMYPVNKDGKSLAWYYDFMKPETNSSFRVYLSMGLSKTEEIIVPEFLPAENTPLANLTIDSDSLPKSGIDSPYDIKEPFVSLSNMAINGTAQPVWQIVSEYNRDEPERQDLDSTIAAKWAMEDGIMYFYLNANTFEFYNANENGFTERNGIRSGFSDKSGNPDIHFKGMFTTNIDSLGTSRAWYYIFHNIETDEVMFESVAGTMNFFGHEMEIDLKSIELIKKMEDMVDWTVRSDEAAKISVDRLNLKPLDFEIRNVSVSLITGVYDPDYQDAAFMSSGNPYWIISFMGENHDGFDPDTSFTIHALSGNFVSVTETELTVSSINLSQNYPNPFNPNTVIMYQLSTVSHVELVVFDLLGREVKTLINEMKPAGNYTVTFSGKDLPSGVYFYQLKSGGYLETKKMVILK